MLEKAAIRGVKLYRKMLYPAYNLTGLTGASSICKLEPSCSHFGEKALHEHGTGKAVIMTAARIYRCGRVQSGKHPVPAAPYSPNGGEKVDAAKTLAFVTGISAACFWMMRKTFR